MKNLKCITILLLSVVISSCSKSDDSNGDIIPRNENFAATIDGGTFSSYQVVMDSNFASSTEGTLTINVTDTNTNIIRLFINGSNSLNTGTENLIGNEDNQGFINNATFRDQANQITYTAVSGRVVILENVIDANDSDISYVTGNFEIVLNSETSSDPVTFNGVFEDIRFVNQL